MQRQQLHNLTSSFCLWFENTLLSKGQAYTNVSSRLYPIKDSDFNYFNIFGSTYKQFVYDSSISGAQIPSGFYVNGNFNPRGQSGLIIDFNQGQALFTGYTSNDLVSGNYAIKDFNIYRTNKRDDELIFENRYLMNPIYPQVAQGVPDDRIVGPAIFLKLTNFTSEPLQIGGINNIKAHYRAIVITDNDFDLDGLANIFINQRQKNFTYCTGTPLNEYDDLKTGSYNYINFAQNYFNYSVYPYLEDIYFSRLLTANETMPDPDIKIGFVDFDVWVNQI